MPNYKLVSINKIQNDPALISDANKKTYLSGVVCAVIDNSPFPGFFLTTINPIDEEYSRYRSTTDIVFHTEGKFYDAGGLASVTSIHLNTPDVGDYKNNVSYNENINPYMQWIYEIDIEKQTELSPKTQYTELDNNNFVAYEFDDKNRKLKIKNTYGLPLELYKKGNENEDELVKSITSFSNIYENNYDELIDIPVTGGVYYIKTTFNYANQYTFITDPINILPYIEETSFTVSFDTNGGSIIPPVKIIGGETVSKPQNPTKEGYYFVNWYSDKSLTVIFDFNTKIYSNITLYAKWTTQYHTIIFESNGGSYIPPITVEDGGKAKIPDNPTRQGYDFVGWYSDEELKYEFYFTASIYEDKTLYAKWRLDVEYGEIIDQTSGTIGGSGNIDGKINEITGDQLATIRNFMIQYNQISVGGVIKDTAHDFSAYYKNNILSISDGMCFAYSYFGYAEKAEFVILPPAVDQYYIVYVELNKSIIPNKCSIQIKNNQSSPKLTLNSLRQDKLSSVKTGVFQLPLYIVHITNKGIVGIEDKRLLKENIQHTQNSDNASVLISGGTLGNNVTCITALAGDNSTLIASTEFVVNEIRSDINK